MITEIQARDQLLVYAKGGLVRSDVHVSGTDTGFFGFSFDASKELHGWSIGGGAEVRLNNSLSIALETWERMGVRGVVCPKIGSYVLDDRSQRRA